MSLNTDTVETAKTGRDLRVIVKDLLGIKTSGAILDGQVLSSYGQSPNQPADTVYTGIVLDACVRQNGGTGEIHEVILREIIASSGTLQKAAVRLYICDAYDLTIQSGTAFALGSTTNKNIKAVIDIAEADWEDIDSLNAIVTKQFTNKSLIAATDTTVMKAVAVMKSTSKSYSANHSMQLELRIKRD